MFKNIAIFIIRFCILLTKINKHDLIGIIGLVLLGYGLYMWQPWVSFTVCGILLMTVAAILAKGD